MSPLTNQAASLFDALTEREQFLVLELIQRLAPDDVASQEDISDIAAARAEYAAGQTVGMDEINWD